MSITEQTDHQAVEHMMLPHDNVPNFFPDFVYKLPCMGNAFV